MPSARLVASTALAAVALLLASAAAASENEWDSWVWPLGNSSSPDLVQSSAFGPRLKVSELYRYDFHRGIDLPAPEGTDAVAVADGVVRIAGSHPSYSDGVVQIQHVALDGEEPLYVYSTYIHMDSSCVAENQAVVRGQKIGETGVGASGFAHLHFELREGGVNQQHAVNPWKYLPDGGRAMRLQVELEEVVDLQRSTVDAGEGGSGTAYESALSFRVTAPSDRLDFDALEVEGVSSAGNGDGDGDGNATTVFAYRLSLAELNRGNQGEPEQLDVPLAWLEERAVGGPPTSATIKATVFTSASAGDEAYALLIRLNGVQWTAADGSHDTLTLRMTVLSARTSEPVSASRDTASTTNSTTVLLATARPACHAFACPAHQYQPVCGTDGVTYRCGGPQLEACAAAAAADDDDDDDLEVGVKVACAGACGCPTVGWPLSGGAEPDVPQRYIYGPRLTSSNKYDWFRGIEIPADLGTPIYAVANGVVRLAGESDAYSNPIIQVMHFAAGDSDDLWYSQNYPAADFQVSPGDYVEQGQLLAFSTGWASSSRKTVYFGTRAGLTKKYAFNPWTVMPVPPPPAHDDESGVFDPRIASLHVQAPCAAGASDCGGDPAPDGWTVESDEDGAPGDVVVRGRVRIGSQAHQSRGTLNVMRLTLTGDYGHDGGDDDESSPSPPPPLLYSRSYDFNDANRQASSSSQMDDDVQPTAKDTPAETAAGGAQQDAWHTMHVVPEHMSDDGVQGVAFTVAVAVPFRAPDHGDDGVASHEETGTWPWAQGGATGVVGDVPCEVRATASLVDVWGARREQSALVWLPCTAPPPPAGFARVATGAQGDGMRLGTLAGAAVTGALAGPITLRECAAAASASDLTSGMLFDTALRSCVLLGDAAPLEPVPGEPEEVEVEVDGENAAALVSPAVVSFVRTQFSARERLARRGYRGQ